MSGAWLSDWNYQLRWQSVVIGCVNMTREGWREEEREEYSNGDRERMGE